MMRETGSYHPMHHSCRLNEVVLFEVLLCPEVKQEERNSAGFHFREKKEKEEKRGKKHGKVHGSEEEQKSRKVLLHLRATLLFYFLFFLKSEFGSEVSCAWG